MDLQPKFTELERVLLEQRHLIGLHSGVPFLLLVYPPDQELECHWRQEHVAEKLRARGTPVLECHLGTFFFDYYKERGYLDKIFELDRDPKQRDNLRRMIAGVYEKNLPGWVMELTKKAEPNGVIFLTSVASLYPFARVSNLLSELENLVRLPMVTFYPGRHSEDGLYFLDSTQPHTGYRARII
jgi:hypothetical protein